MLFCATGWVVPDVLKEDSAFIFRVRQSKWAAACEDRVHYIGVDIKGNKGRKYLVIWLGLEIIYTGWGLHVDLYNRAGGQEWR